MKTSTTELKTQLIDKNDEKARVLGTFSILFCYLYIFTGIVYPRILGFEFILKDTTFYNLFMMAGFSFSFMIFIMNKRARSAWISGVLKSKFIVGTFIVYILIQILSDIQQPHANITLLETAKSIVYIHNNIFISSIIFLDSRNRSIMINTIIMSTMIAVAIGLIELASGSTLFKLLGIHLSGYATNSLAAGTSREGAHRVQSIFSSPILYGQFLASVVPLIAFKLKSAKSPLVKLAIIGLFITVPVALWSTGTRSPLVCLAVSMGLYLSLNFLSKRNSGVTGAVALLSLGLIFAGLGSMYMGELMQLVKGRTSSEMISSMTRELQFTNGLFALKKKPTFGYGEGMAPIVAGSSNQGILSIDCYFLSVAIDGGWLGLIAFSAFSVSILFTGTILALKDRSLCALTSMAAALVVGLLVISINDNLTFIHWVAGYIIASQARIPEPARSRFAAMKARRAQSLPSMQAT